MQHSNRPQEEGSAASGFVVGVGSTSTLKVEAVQRAFDESVFNQEEGDNAAPEPQRWNRYVDSTSGRSYFFNPKTQVTTWEVPEENELTTIVWFPNKDDERAGGDGDEAEAEITGALAGVGESERRPVRVEGCKAAQAEAAQDDERPR